MKYCLCGKEINGHGHNPYPLDKGKDVRCCDKCNVDVIYKRLTLAEKKILKSNES